MLLRRTVLSMTVLLILPFGPSALAAPATVRAGAAQPDPALAFLPTGAKIDWAAVNRSRDAKIAQRTQQQAALSQSAKPAPLPYAEHEAAGAHGVNDTPATAEVVAGFGTRKGKNPRAALSGDLAPDGSVVTLPRAAEDNGSLALATGTGVAGTRRAVVTSGVIGDGPHGSAGDGTGDFDFYKISGGSANSSATLTTATPTGGLDTALALYDAGGTLLVLNDNTTGSTDSSLTVPLTAGVDYYVLVSTSGPSLPSDPANSGSGGGVGIEGPYNLSISVGESNGDNDVYAVDLRAGDVLGASVAGGAKHLSIRDATGREVMGSSQDATYIYPAQSPLPGGGNAVADFVAPKDGRYTVGVQLGEGHYDVTLEAYRPGTETLPRDTVQTLFLDFDGARVNTAIFDGPGVRQLSPFANFLSGWGLGPADEDAVIDGVVATVRENFQRDLAAKGTNPRFGVRILNSRDDRDPFGQPNVTRLVVGGTVAESGVNTIGIAQSIDPGNFGHEETALVLLDYLSAPAGGPSSINNYLTATSNRTKFVGQAIGNVVSHEAGHMSGSWHLDQFDAVASLMDQGGNPAVMFGVGPDGVGGTADDPDVDFVEDVLNPNEGFTGVEDVLARTAWAYSRGTA